MKTKSNTFRKYLKRHGRENQFFITSYIGIDLIQPNQERPENLSTTWHPKDIDNSKRESKLFIQKASLAYSVSTFESFFDDFFLNEVNQLIPEELSFLDAICGNGTKKSIYKKLELLIDNFSDLRSKEYFLVKSAIFWRNDLIHDTREKFDSDMKANLRKYAQEFEESYSGLDINEFINHYDANKVPSFKETLSLMTSLRNFSAQVDKYFMEKISVEKYVGFILNQRLDAGMKVVKTNPKKQYTFWNNIISTYVGLSERDLEEFQKTQLGINLYEVTSNEELLELVSAY